MRWADVALLDDAGFSLYEKRALVTLALLGVADAATLCREGEIPTSKIHQAMEKLGSLGLLEIQRTRPKLYSALPPDVVVDRLVQIARERAEDFASRSGQLKDVLASLPGRLRGRQTFVDLALGTESHVKRHLARLASARQRILSYMEEGDLLAVDRVARDGFDVLKRLSRVASERKLDHPFVPEGRFASLLVRDRSLADSLAQGFEALWQKALKSLGEIRFLPRRRPQ